MKSWPQGQEVGQAGGVQWYLSITASRKAGQNHEISAVDKKASWKPLSHRQVQRKIASQAQVDHEYF